MIVGVPKETKSDEYRVSMLPAGVEVLVEDGHKVLIQRGAGANSGYEDQQYRAVGGEIIDDAEDVWQKSEMIVKVKEPMAQELDLMVAGQTIFTYFHFAASLELTKGCLDSRVTAIAYETLTDNQGRLPLLTPMSEVAGRMSVQEGAKYLEKPMEGRGVLLGGVPGVEPGNVLILGGGVVGTQAAKLAAGLGARVTILDVNLDRLRYLDDVMPANVSTCYSDAHSIRDNLALADLVIGAVLIPGARAPQLITRDMLKAMKPGAVIVDVGVDQGGCVETTRPTTHSEPIYIVDGVVHYCVANMPGAVGRTSTQALCHATQSYTRRLAMHGADKLIRDDESFLTALNTRDGKLTNRAVADAHGLTEYLAV